MKQIIVMRTDIDMSVGKMCAQAGHAGGGYQCPRIVVRIEGEKNLLDLVEWACDEGLRTRLIYDAGHTELPPNTLTCAAIGPNDDKAVDKVTGNLKLL